MSSMKEIWKDIPGYEGLYQVSNLGKVKSLDADRVVKSIHRGWKTCERTPRDEVWHRKGKELKPIAPHGTHISSSVVRLYNNKQERKSIPIKYLVACAFLEGFDPDTKYIKIKSHDTNKLPSIDNIYISK